MAILGTKKFWKPAAGASATQRESQILKNSGYLNLQLHSVNYMSVGNFWQSNFGGKDNIVLATTLKYQSGVNTIEATSVQDVREVKVNHNYNLGLQRNIAVKIPANADAISVNVKITAVKNDSLQAKFDMLNKAEYQSALQLSPPVVGQVLTITSLVKKLFTDSESNAQLEASYAGIISTQPEDNPISNGKLTKGMLIVISTNDGNQFDDVDELQFELRGDTLYYNKEQVENTYLVFNISFDLLKGEDENSNWFKKYNDSLNNLDKIQLATDQAEIIKIYNDSKTMWIEGNALIDTDETYINSERIKIKNLAIKSINDKYKDLVQPNQPVSITFSNDILSGLTGSANFHAFKEALPFTAAFLGDRKKIDPAKPVSLNLFTKQRSAKSNLFEFLEKDSETYLRDLENNNIEFKLGKIRSIPHRVKAHTLKELV